MSTQRASAPKGIAPLRADWALFESLVPERDVAAPFSKWSVGAHVEHCALASTSMVRALADNAGAPPPRGLNRPFLMRSVILWTGWLPRGRAEAPEFVLPKSTTEGDLRDALARSLEAIDRLAEAPPDAWMRHFALGAMRRDAVLRFLHVHNRHHLKIIRDIRQSTDAR